MTNHEKQMAAIERQCKAANCGCVPEGWVLVPVEPTQAMILAGADKVNGRPTGKAARYVMADSYRAMLAAAPAAPTKGARDAGVGTLMAWYCETDDGDWLFNTQNCFPGGHKGQPIYARPDPLLAEAVEALERCAEVLAIINLAKDCATGSSLTAEVAVSAVLAKVQAAKEQAS